MTTHTLTFLAGEKKQLPGGIFCLLLTTSSAVNLQFFRSNTSLGGVITGVTAGFSIGPFQRNEPFEWVEIQSLVAQTIKVFVTDVAEANYNTISGNVTSTPVVPSILLTQADILIAGYGGITVSYPNLARREGIITSLSTNTAALRVGDINLGLDRGFPLMPGDSLILETTAQIYVLNTLATAQSVSFTEINA